MKRVWVRFLVAAVSTVLLMTSCPNPIPTTLANQVSDETGPVIAITSPAERDEYGTIVQMTGTVTDGDPPAAANVTSCRYEVRGTSVSGAFTPADDGTFSVLFATRATDGARLMDGTVTLEVSAVDWNGNVSAETVELVPASTGDVTGFGVTPSNGSAVIEWDPVPGAESYDLIEYKYGLSRTGVTSPYEWTGLTNGEVYRFQVRANTPDELGPDAYSNTVEKMPLSPRSLAPWVREVGYGTITVEWWENPNVAEYTVERSTAPDGPWEVRRNLAANRFTDADLEHDTEYYYRVRPAAFPEIASDYQTAVPTLAAACESSTLPIPRVRRKTASWIRRIRWSLPTG